MEKSNNSANIGNNKNKSLRLLLVEDSEDDAFLLIRTIKKAGYDLIVERVFTREDMEKSLAGNSWDLIISDYQMPQFSGSEALSLAKTFNIDIPFIIVSGKIGEDVAVDSMRAGAQDYVLKDNLSRLIPAIEREIADSQMRIERKEAIIAREESESKYHLLVETVPVGVFQWILTNDEGLAFANSALYHMLGYSSLEEFKSIYINSLFIEKESRDLFFNIIKEQKIIHGLEIQLRCKDDSKIWTRINATITEESGKKWIDGIIEDITDKKDNEKALGRANKKLALLHDITTNDIEKHLFTISGYTTLLKTRITDGPNRPFIENLLRSLFTLQQNIEFAKNYSDMGINLPRWQKVNDVALFAISHLDFLPVEKSFTLGSLEVYADPLFEKALYNIFDNILKHGEEIKKVEMTYEVMEDKVIITILDNGMGVPPEDKERIFMKDPDKKKHRSLFLTREILHITGIKILESGTYTKGAKFEMIIPEGMFRIFD